MIQIRDLIIGEGKPKIVVPIDQKTERQIIPQSQQAFVSPAEIIEWRADYFENWKDDNAVLRILKSIRMNIGAKALLFTFRSKEEGSNVAIKDGEYLHLLKLAIDSRLIDLIDVECCVSEYRAIELISYAHEKKVPVIGSNHSFIKLLTIGEMDYRIRYMQKLGVDIAKIVVQPERKKDVYKILCATYDLCEDLELPIAVLGRSDIGKYTRVLGEMFGSCMTWSTLSKAENPGEIDVYRISEIISSLHDM